MSSSSSTSLASEKSERLPETTISHQFGDEEKPPSAPPIPAEDDVEEQQDDLTDDPFLVCWEPGEKANPFEWSTGYKSWVTFQLSMMALTASLASSITAPAEAVIASYTGVSQEVAVLSISLYVLGFAFGPLTWAPISEIWGRRWSMLPATFVLGIFSIGTATSTNITSVLITRFLGGLFGSAPVSNVSAALGDIWPVRIRGVPMALYSVAVVGGPTLGSPIAASLVVSLNWRWTEYVTAIFTFAIVIVNIFCLPEVYGPYLLSHKARRLRKETGNSSYYHPHESVKVDLNSLVTKHFSRPLIMLTTEPMVTCIAFYASFVFALLYATLEVFPIVFHDHRGWPLFPSTLPFIALFVGVLFAVLVNLANQPRYARISAAAGGKPVPEARLPPMCIGAFSFAIGLFWFGWTAAPDVPWPVPVVAIGFIGAGFNIIFQQCLNFLVDTYRLYAASATSANTFLRSLLGAGLPLVARPMFHRLGVGPAMSLLGGVATLAIPVPFLFMKYGLALRKRSKFAPVED